MVYNKDKKRGKYFKKVIKIDFILKPIFHNRSRRKNCAYGKIIESKFYIT